MLDFKRYRGAVYYYFFKFWNIVDVVNLALFAVMFIMWIAFISRPLRTQVCLAAVASCQLTPR